MVAIAVSVRASFFSLFCLCIFFNFFPQFSIVKILNRIFFSPMYSEHAPLFMNHGQPHSPVVLPEQNYVCGQELAIMPTKWFPKSSEKEFWIKEFLELLVYRQNIPLHHRGKQILDHFSHDDSKSYYTFYYYVLLKLKSDKYLI